MTPSVSLRPAASRAGERSAFPANPAFYNKATPSVTFGDSSPTGGAKEVDVPLASKIMAQAGFPCARALNLYPQGT